GTAVLVATNLTLNLLPQSLGNGTHSVSAVVRDNTTLVRTDPTNLLSQTITWTLVVNLPYLRLDSLRWLAGGQFAFRVNGQAPQNFSLQASSNLVNWVPALTNSLVGGQFWYTNAAASNVPKQFFRAVAAPYSTRM